MNDPRRSVVAILALTLMTYAVISGLLMLVGDAALDSDAALEFDTSTLVPFGLMLIGLGAGSALMSGWLSTRRPHSARPRPRPAVRRQGEPSDHQGPVPTTGPLGERWRLARDRHTRVKEAYAQILTDPLNALTHSVLFDVSDERTARFVTAYSLADDLYDVSAHRDRSESEVAQYEGAVHRLGPLWLDALRYAEKVGAEWMSARDQALAEAATKMLRLARDPGATEAERLSGLRRAHANMASIRSFHLPPGAALALENQVRLALPGPDLSEPGQTHRGG
ncbi:hypothetical protein [Nocardioides sp. Leaf285]|uniref:hypothetical protein n=1 Tax=Nocardioides sp. Leaf285 TaxID=1736322 RepID=UPI0007028C4F|nr:hypothetical protein [Nocardioides sp. Leaf285]KQP63168.1 hypothetical protein ASF47_19350 [Nocardioides sp. Leaf285]